MDQLWRDVLTENRSTIVQSADIHDVFLDSLIDHLLSKSCIQVVHQEFIKRGNVSGDRIRKLLDFISSADKRAFDELCNGMEAFGTDDKKCLADSLRESLKCKQEQARKDSPGTHVFC